MQPAWRKLWRNVALPISPARHKVMCGIAGILTTDSALELRPLLRTMLRTLRHRGPDDEGCQELCLAGGTRIGLAHTRLSILDVSAAGRQPMGDPHSGSWITYNGEVYNHRSIRRQFLRGPFHSNTDTETILKAWAAQGDGILASFRGMFAFGLYDGRRQRFWLVRDRLGIKPLYACQLETGTWLFASEVRALLATGLLSRRLHSQAVRSYLAYGAVPAPWTLLDSVESLMPGECWSFDLSTSNARLAPERRPYWAPPFAPRETPAVDRTEAIERIRPVLREAVSLQMLSDVPVGVFLSGGIDSSGIVAVLAHQGFKVHTISMVFGEQQFDESQHSREIARRFGTCHTELLLHPNRVLNDFEEALDAYDQPSIDGQHTYFLSQATREAGIKVALSGLGGDELFAGYSSFHYLNRLEGRLSRLAALLLYPAMRWARPDSPRAWRLGLILNGDGSRMRKLLACHQVFSPERLDSIFPLAQDAASASLPPEVYARLAGRAGELDPTNAHSLLELSLYMGNVLLRDTDQMSMAHALEVRVPLLDHILVEAVAQIPGAMKLSANSRAGTKSMLVDALPTSLPTCVTRRPKMGFVLPWEGWLRNELRDYTSAVLERTPILQAVGLNRTLVHRTWQDFLAHRGGVRASMMLSLINLLHWVGKHGLTINSENADLSESETAVH